DAQWRDERRPQFARRSECQEQPVEVDHEELVRGGRHGQHLEEAVGELYEVVAAEGEVVLLAPVALHWEEVGDFPGRFRLAERLRRAACCMAHGCLLPAETLSLTSLA